jgi:hypothetical protein
MAGRYAAVLDGTGWEHRLVVGVKGAHLQVRFIEEVFPLHSHVIIADDNVRKFVKDHRASSKEGGHMPLKYDESEGEPSELAMLIRRAAKEMDRQSVNIWSINPSYNHYVLYNFAETVRVRMEKFRLTSEECDFTPRLGLIYGAFFGFRVLHDPERYTRYGQVKDDVERTLRYWHLDGMILRFMRYGVVKTHKPGQFNANKGGISAASTFQKHQEEQTKALQSMIDEFAAPIARLPKEKEQAACGIVFTCRGLPKKFIPYGASTTGKELTAKKAKKKKQNKKLASEQDLCETAVLANKKKKSDKLAVTAPDQKLSALAKDKDRHRDDVKNQQRSASKKKDIHQNEKASQTKKTPKPKEESTSSKTSEGKRKVPEQQAKGPTDSNSTHQEKKATLQLERKKKKSL